MITEGMKSAPAGSIVDAEATVRALLRRVYGARAGAAKDAFATMGMAVSELIELFTLVQMTGAREILEIGMGSGTSSVVFCEAFNTIGGGHLTSIDPFQSDARHFAAAGVRAIRAAGFASQHRLIEEPDYLALPSLLRDGRSFDLMFIDGWHSFDYTLVDLFYGDLLLRDGGILAVHDTTLPAVYRAVRFLEAHKPYERISPPIMVELPTFIARAWRRLRTVAAGRQTRAAARARRERWRMLAAYRKIASVQCRETAANF